MKKELVPVDTKISWDLKIYRIGSKSLCWVVVILFTVKQSYNMKIK